ncbi:MAG TPA: hypothetical protein VIK47_04500, partial [Kiloniellales bacterium]
MTGSPASNSLTVQAAFAVRPWRRGGARLAAMAFALTMAAPAVGAADDPAPQAPTTLVPGAAAPTATEATPAVSTTPLIEVNPLGEISLDSVGVLGPDNGGFGQDLWRGADR